jgi:hypothetical protein
MTWNDWCVVSCLNTKWRIWLWALYTTFIWDLKKRISAFWKTSNCDTIRTEESTLSWQTKQTFLRNMTSFVHTIILKIQHNNDISMDGILWKVIQNRKTKHKSTKYSYFRPSYFYMTHWNCWIIQFLVVTEMSKVFNKGKIKRINGYTRVKSMEVK